MSKPEHKFRRLIAKLGLRRTRQILVEIARGGHRRHR